MKKSILFTIILAITFGLLAGFLGQIIGKYYLSDELSGFSLSREFDLLESRSNLIIRDARKVVVSHDKKIEETSLALKQNIYKVFDLNNLDKPYFPLNRPDFLAIAITSDGWLMSSKPDNIDLDDDLKDQIKVIGPNNSVYDISELVVYQSTLTDLLFIKVDNLSNALASKSALSSELIAGQTLIIYGKNNSIVLGSLIDYAYENEVLSSDIYNRRLSVLAPEALINNSFAFNLAGDFVGLIDSDSNFNSAPHLAIYWRSLIKNKEISHPYFGIDYLNLANIKFLENNLNRGAYIYDVKEDSPADISGLKEGDIIFQINGRNINENLDLAEYVLSFNKGDILYINFYRNGEEKNTRLKLDKKYEN